MKMKTLVGAVKRDLSKGKDARMMKKTMMVAAAAALCGCCCEKWTEPMAGAGALESKFDFEAGVWHEVEPGVITAEKDSAIWLKGEYENFVLDFDYKLDPAANSGVVIYCSDLKNWIPNSIEVQLLDDYADKWKNDPPRLRNAGLYGHCGPEKSVGKPAGEWNHMTITAQGKKVKVVCNEVVTVDEDISRYTSAKVNPDGTPIQPWLSKPLATLPTKGGIGFQGKHGGARPYFRNIRIRGL